MKNNKSKSQQVEENLDLYKFDTVELDKQQKDIENPYENNESERLDQESNKNISDKDINSSRNASICELPQSNNSSIIKIQKPLDGLNVEDVLSHISIPQSQKEEESKVDVSLEEISIDMLEGKLHNQLISKEQMSEQQVNHQEFQIYLFCNPKSGGQTASVLLKQKEVTARFQDPHKQSPSKVNVTLKIFNLFEKQNVRKGMQSLKEASEMGYRCRVIVGGGDGTVMWVVSEMQKHDINFEKVALGIIPFGTGNDFSRVIGWGGKNPSGLDDPKNKKLKKLMGEWIKASKENFDIWEIFVEVHEKGSFHVIEKTGNSFQKKVMYEKQPNGKSITKRRMKRYMCNYFSVGIGARVSFNFEKRRSNSQCGNICCYAWEGFKKCFIKTRKINEVIDYMYTINTNEDNMNAEISEIGMDQTVPSLKKTVISTRTSKQKFPEDPGLKQIFLSGNPINLVCCNIPSFMGGSTNPWGTTKGKSGIVDKQYKKIDQFQNQNFGDGQLEFVQFPNYCFLSIEKVCNGNSRRVAQDTGPFVIKFKTLPNQQQLRTYFQIDGEGFQMMNPKQIIIRLSKQFNNGKIKVLVKQKLKKGK